MLKKKKSKVDLFFLLNAWFVSTLVRVRSYAHVGVCKARGGERWLVVVERKVCTFEFC